MYRFTTDTTYVSSKQHIKCGIHGRNTAQIHNLIKCLRTRFNFTNYGEQSLTSRLLFSSCSLYPLCLSADVWAWNCLCFSIATLECHFFLLTPKSANELLLFWLVDQKLAYSSRNWYRFSTDSSPELFLDSPFKYLAAARNNSLLFAQCFQLKRQAFNPKLLQSQTPLLHFMSMSHRMDFEFCDAISGIATVKGQKTRKVNTDENVAANRTAFSNFRSAGTRRITSRSKIVSSHDVLIHTKLTSTDYTHWSV